ncbi:unnamed protein product [Paramecium primaurelia]|uniref:Uncharacterized protein n=1 Tax=Paramecium primaurelia TaxID=5886 RepID=A0A8S1LVJ5_PARPR|nr:unnamed protein product [Paramecium primaurelia]
MGSLSKKSIIWKLLLKSIIFNSISYIFKLSACSDATIPQTATTDTYNSLFRYSMKYYQRQLYKLHQFSYTGIPLRDGVAITLVNFWTVQEGKTKKYFVKLEQISILILQHTRIFQVHIPSAVTQLSGKKKFFQSITQDGKPCTYDEINLLLLINVILQIHAIHIMDQQVKKLLNMVIDLTKQIIHSEMC